MRLDACWQAYTHQCRVHIGDLTARCISAGSKSSKGAAGKRSLFLLYMDAVSIVNQRAASDSSKNSDQLSQPIDHLPAHQATSFTLRDLHFIIKFAKVTFHAALCIGVLCSARVLHRDMCAQSLCAVQHRAASARYSSVSGVETSSMVKAACCPPLSKWPIYCFMSTAESTRRLQYGSSS